MNTPKGDVRGSLFTQACIPCVVSSCGVQGQAGGGREPVDGPPAGVAPNLICVLDVDYARYHVAKR